MDPDITITPAIAKEVIAAASSYRKSVRMPFEGDSVELFGFDPEGRPAFVVRGTRWVRKVPKKEPAAVGGLFADPAEEIVDLEPEPDHVYVWAKNLPFWIPQQLLNPERTTSTEGPHIFGRHVREVAHS